MTDHPRLDVDRVVAALDRNGVAYLLVGGVACRFHGAERLTEDIDVLPLDDDDNLGRLRRRWGSWERSFVSVA